MSAASARPVSHPFETPPEPGCAITVAEGVLWMRAPLPMRLDHVNVYALDDGAGWTIVDTGFDTEVARGVWQRLLSGPLQGRPVLRVIVTHHHADHIGLAGWFQHTLGAELWTTRTSWLLARMLTLDLNETPTPEHMAFWRAAGESPDMLERRARERPYNMADRVAPLPLGYRRISEGDTIEAAGRRWTVRMGAGHAPEHATLWSADCPLVLGGDQLLPRISPVLGVQVAEPDADPVGDWLAACARLARIAREDHLVLPGHMLPYTGLPLRLRQLADHHHVALERLLAFLDRPRTAIACFEPLFRRRIEPEVHNLALGEALAHLNHLLRQGRVERTMGPEGAWHWQRCAG